MFLLPKRGDAADIPTKPRFTQVVKPQMRQNR